MYSESLVGTVKAHDAHLFLVDGDASSWPSKEFEREGDGAFAVNEALRSAAGAYKSAVHQFAPGASALGRVKLNLSETGARAHPDDAPGDVLVFPQMRRVRLGADFAASPASARAFVETVVVRGEDRAMTADESESDAKTPGGPFASSPLRGAHVFVCTHGSRDARCGIIGPDLVEAFRAAVEADEDPTLASRVAIRGCSHVGGHKYAGNVLVFVPRGGLRAEETEPEPEPEPSSGGGALAAGHWLGYVTPEDIPEIVARVVRRGEPVPRLWRGSTGADPDAHEDAAAKLAAASGEPWPPPPAASPCDACDRSLSSPGKKAEAAGKKAAALAVGDIEDVVAGDATAKARRAKARRNAGDAAAKEGGERDDARDRDPAEAKKPEWVATLESVFTATAAAGAAGLAWALFAARDGGS